MFISSMPYDTNTGIHGLMLLNIVNNGLEYEVICHNSVTNLYTMLYFHNMHDQFLQNIGLTPDQIAIYLSLLKTGAAPVRKIIPEAKIKRGLAYKVIDQLIELGLVEKKEEDGKVTLFAPSHPERLKKMLQEKEESLKTTSSALSEVLGKLSSEFNLISGKPNVQFFEGLAGIEEVLDDSLYAKSEIYSYADLESIEKYIKVINKKYVEKREKFGIKKKGIVLDTDFNRKFLQDYHTDITDTKLIKSAAVPFQTVMQIYDNKISYMTLTDKEMIGVIIEDKNISTMHKNIFEYLWGITPDFV
jgi:sugar-specific transcriptional regulator TrmB